MFKTLYSLILQNKRQILFQFLFIVLLGLLLIVDDFIFQLFSSANQVALGKWLLWGTAIAFILSFSKNIKFIYSVLAIYCFFDMVQLVYMAYFGTTLTPFAIPLLFDMENFRDVAKSGFTEIKLYWYGVFSVAIPYIFAFLLIKKYNNQLYKINYFWVFLVILLSHFPYRAYNTATISRVLASYERPSIYNGFKIVNSYIFKILIQNKSSNKHFEEYEIEHIKNNDDIDIIIVYGESFNWQHSSLFGYKLETSPLLKQFKKENPDNFYYSKGVSCATFTATSIPTFFNYQKEPENVSVQINKKTNLFKLAKEKNFYTAWLSMQRKSLLNNLLPQFIDKIVVADDYDGKNRHIIDNYQDELLLGLLQDNLKEGQKNLIVLHQINMHSPHLDWKLQHEKEFGKFESNYDNAQLYEDFMVDSWLQFLKKNAKKPTYFFLISDHGSMQDDGMHGHGLLEAKVSDVPVFYWTNVKNSKITNKFKKIFTPTCHQVYDLIAELVGYKVIDPNAKENVYYVQGTDLSGKSGYIKVIKDEKAKTIKYE